MGDMADYYRELELENHLDGHGSNFTTDYTIWTTKQGVKIEVVKMTDNHLLNTINMLNNNANEANEEWFDVLVLEAKKRKLYTPNKSMYFECDVSEVDLY